MNPLNKFQREYYQLEWEKYDIYEANEICEESWVYRESLDFQRWIQIINGRMLELKPYMKM